MLTLHRAHIDTPLGPMLALATADALCALEFHRGERLTRLERRLARWFPAHEFVDAPNGVIACAGAWLDCYFAGADARADAGGDAGADAAADRDARADRRRAPRLDMRGAPFERRVWDALRTIPPGATASYGEIARRLGDPGASRAVGMANGANPVAILVPCHRVIGANGSLTGYGGGLDRKKWLLDHERRWRAGRLF